MRIIPTIALITAQWSLNLASDPFEAFCTSESDFNADAPVFSSCKGNDSQACERAGGMYTSDDGGKCNDIDTSTSNACDIISGFKYEVSSCAEIGSYVSYNAEAASYKNCSSPYVLQYILPTYQDKCCGGKMNNKNICPNTRDPSIIPSSIPSLNPSMFPSAFPSVLPSVYPSSSPNETPSLVPSLILSSDPSIIPTSLPSLLPSAVHSFNPSLFPSDSHTLLPSIDPTMSPSHVPSAKVSVFGDPNVIPRLNSSFIFFDLSNCQSYSLKW